MVYKAAYDAKHGNGLKILTLSTNASKTTNRTCISKSR